MQTIIEFGDFHKDALRLLGQSGYEEFIAYIALHPSAGDVVAGTGGFRKLRWSRPGKGKRGGARVIYFYEASPVYLYLIYAKNEADNLTAKQKEMLRQAAQLLKEEDHG